jgi:hypothetical protein
MVKAKTGNLPVMAASTNHAHNDEQQEFMILKAFPACGGDLLSLINIQVISLLFFNAKIRTSKNFFCVL